VHLGRQFKKTPFCGLRGILCGLVVFGNLGRYNFFCQSGVVPFQKVCA
jgi:hypothetical protein